MVWQAALPWLGRAALDMGLFTAANAAIEQAPALIERTNDLGIPGIPNFGGEIKLGTPRRSPTRENAYSVDVTDDKGVTKSVYIEDDRMAKMAGLGSMAEIKSKIEKEDKERVAAQGRAALKELRKEDRAANASEAERNRENAVTLQKVATGGVVDVAQTTDKGATTRQEMVLTQQERESQRMHDLALQNLENNRYSLGVSAALAGHALEVQNAQLENENKAAKHAVERERHGNIAAGFITAAAALGKLFG